MSEIVMFRQDYVRFQESTYIFVRSMVGDPYFFTLGLGPHHVLMRSLGYNVVGRTICRLLDSEGEVGHLMWSKSLIDLSQLGENLKLSQVALCFFNVSVPRGRGEIHT